MPGPTVSQPIWLRSKTWRFSAKRISSESGSSSTGLSTGWSSARDSTATSTVSTFLLDWDRLRLPSTSPWDRSVSVMVSEVVVVVSHQTESIGEVKCSRYLPRAGDLASL